MTHSSSQPVGSTHGYLALLLRLGGRGLHWFALGYLIFHVIRADAGSDHVVAQRSVQLLLLAALQLLLSLAVATWDYAHRVGAADAEELVTYLGAIMRRLKLVTRHSPDTLARWCMLWLYGVALVPTLACYGAALWLGVELSHGAWGGIGGWGPLLLALLLAAGTYAGAFARATQRLRRAVVARSRRLNPIH